MVAGATTRGKPLVSFEQKIAEGLGLDVGDDITVNVLGRNITATIANLRTVEWRTLGINFVMVFSPNTFAGAPHTHLATVTFPNGADAARDAAILRETAKAFPTVTSVRVKDALEAVNDIVGQLAWRSAARARIALVASLLVLAGALAAGHRARLYDAVVLKTLGATRARLLSAYALEYGALGLATAVFGLIAGTRGRLLRRHPRHEHGLRARILGRGPRRGACRRRRDHARACRHLAHPRPEAGALPAQPLSRVTGPARTRRARSR